MRSYDKLGEGVSSPDLLFPGHDPKMTTKYEAVAEGVTLLVKDVLFTLGSQAKEE